VSGEAVCLVGQVWHSLAGSAVCVLVLPTGSTYHSSGYCHMVKTCNFEGVHVLGVRSKVLCSACPLFESSFAFLLVALPLVDLQRVASNIEHVVCISFKDLRESCV